MVKLEYRAPAKALLPYISVYYLFQCDETRYVGGERAAVSQLRFCLQGHGKIIFGKGNIFDSDGSWLAGPTSHAVEYEIYGPYKLFGVGILPAGWGGLTRASACDYLDKMVVEHEILTRSKGVMEDLSKLNDLSEMAEYMDKTLSGWFDSKAEKVLKFTKLVDDWLTNSPSPELGDLHAMANLSPRQLTRRVKQYYGMPPKQLARKYRALRAARALVDGESEDADYLRDAFFDQSHMIKELKIYAGVTPSQLRISESEIARLIDKRQALAGQVSSLITKT